tara:strand:+ start:1583 stop:1738 length:156 start_codon:yes stop_codon:yes gene_type:complete
MKVFQLKIINIKSKHPIIIFKRYKTEITKIEQFNTKVLQKWPLFGVIPAIY